MKGGYMDSIIDLLYLEDADITFTAIQIQGHTKILYHSDFRVDPHFHVLMNTYDYEIFREFASLLEKYQDPIINSFIMVKKSGMEKYMIPVYRMVLLNY